MHTTVTIAHAGGTRFEAVTGSGHTVAVDGGDHRAGAGPMELVLVALGTCSAVTIIELLAKMRQPLEGLEVRVTGDRRDAPPRVYERIHVRYRVSGQVDPARVERTIDLVESKYCSVWTMLAATVTMSHSVEYATVPPAETPLK